MSDEQHDPADEPSYRQLGEAGNPFRRGGSGASDEPGGDLEVDVAAESEPGVHRRSDDEVAAEGEPGVHRWSDDEVAAESEPGVHRRSDDEVAAESEPGVHRRSDDEVDRADRHD
ncbi:hypothetical protein QT381_01225 [Galbitalea sp. SE-J8]|uniref:hypothetical protein n=1 Tax=Galbitalea sp. SE-J8 TaxID=3054952 RepID=UPI00259C7485|nr:hypothetical protein [Galbitalea sp. SE-J8]MDM4761629.1 hypothetical protein [Galbitalea sp. SE-J8]